MIDKLVMCFNTYVSMIKLNVNNFQKQKGGAYYDR